VSVAAADAAVRRLPRFIVVLGGLTAVNLAINLLTLVTGPLQARLLGPQGRGELALILVVTGLAPAIGLGLGSFLAREIKQTSERGVVLGTVVVLSIGLGSIGALLAYPVSRLFGETEEVHTLIFVGLLLLPIFVVALNLQGAYWGDERWRLHSAMRLIVPAVIVCGYVALAIVGAFTVVSATLTVFVASIAAALPLWWLVRSTRGWGFDLGVARRGLAFGSKASAAAVTNLANLRIDQLFVAGLVSARELGYYVVAGTLATATLLVSQSLNLIVVPMVAAGDHHSVRRILRITLALMLPAATLLAILADPLVGLVFGPEFAPSADLTRVLCFGSVFFAGKGIVSAALVGRGRPGETALVELAMLVGLVGALVLVVPTYGATGAAVTVVLANAAGLAVLALRARQWLGGGLHEYFLPTATDITWLVGSLRNRTLPR
jgi:O-antigen/teichoic acid export membrane protein